MEEGKVIDMPKGANEVPKQANPHARFKMIYYALLEAAMRYKEAFWRDDVEQYNQFLDTQLTEMFREKILSPSRQRKLETKFKGLSLAFEQSITAFNEKAYKEIDTVKAQFSDKADTGFDNYATGFGLIIEKYVDAKNTSDLLLICEAYNKGLLDELIKEIHQSNKNHMEQQAAEQIDTDPVLEVFPPDNTNRDEFAHHD